MLQTVSFMAYLLVGAAIFSHVEGWTFLDAIYWADFTCLTVGIGDYAPSTHLGRSLLFPYAIGGIVSLGLVVGSIRSMVLDRGKEKLHARMTEKTRESVLKRISGMDNKFTGSRLRGFRHETINKVTLDPTSCRMSEMERRRAEFEAMRAVQDLAATKRKWISLGMSGGVFVLLWVIGAVVFYKAEKNQGWTYFGSLYFAYTSLLTIGYGDFQPQSNSGKPFFVFWSLLAVPALTILISDMGDTVVKIIKDFTIYLGEITVLPSDEGGLSDRLKYGVYKMTGVQVGNKVSVKIDEEIKKNARNIPRQDEHHGPKRQDVEGMRHVADDLEKDEKRDEQAARDLGDKVAEDEHHYQHMLLSEMRKMYSYVNQKPPKKFTYEEWAHYLRLLGEDEHDQRYHRRAPIKVKNRQEVAIFDRSDAPSIGNVDDQRSGSQDDIREWSWLGNRSPLMGDKDEAEWILERLFAVLERELRKQMGQRDSKPSLPHQHRCSHNSQSQANDTNQDQ